MLPAALIANLGTYIGRRIWLIVGVVEQSASCPTGGFDADSRQRADGSLIVRRVRVLA